MLGCLKTAIDIAMFAVFWWICNKLGDWQAPMTCVLYFNWKLSHKETK